MSCDIFASLVTAPPPDWQPRRNRNLSLTIAALTLRKPQKCLVKYLKYIRKNVGGRIRSALLLTLMGACLAAPLQLAATPAFAESKVTATRIAGDDQRTRFVADVTKPVSFTVYVLPDPYRVVVDLANLSFDLPQGVGHKVRGLVKQYRYGIVEQGKSRMVIDTNGPVLIDKSFLVPEQKGQPARIVIDLVQTSEEAFAEAFHNAQVSDRQQAAEQGGEPPASQSDTPEEDQAAAPAAAQQQAPVKQTAADDAHKSGKRLVVIDPGHGGIDPGALSPKGTKEKDVVFATAKALQRALEQTGRYEVRLTREDDKFVPLKQRRDIARQAAADLFIAIHADTVRGPAARGMTIYTLSDKASDAEAEELASKENQADIIGGLDLETENPEVTNILIDLAQRESKNHAMLFSKKAVGELKPLTLMTGKPQRSAGFVVLKAPDVPSVLVELGYLSSREDEALLTSKAWQGKIAKGMAAAVDKYFQSDVALRQ